MEWQIGRVRGQSIRCLFLRLGYAILVLEVTMSYARVGGHDKLLEKVRGSIDIIDYLYLYEVAVYSIVYRLI